MKPLVLPRDNLPIGYVTWAARLRDGTWRTEYVHGEDDVFAQVSFDTIASRDDVDLVELLPFLEHDHRSPCVLMLQPGERVVKKWIRTFQVVLQTGRQCEGSVIDCFTILSDLPINHFYLADGTLIVTTKQDI